LTLENLTTPKGTVMLRVRIYEPEEVIVVG